MQQKAFKIFQGNSFRIFHSDASQHLIEKEGPGEGDLLKGTATTPGGHEVSAVLLELPKAQNYRGKPHSIPVVIL